MEHAEPSFYIADSLLGFAAFATKDIKKGEHLYTFTGTPINYQRSIELGKNESYSLQVSASHYVLLDPPGKFINHSCDPNAGIIAGVELVAIRDIRKNQQIAYDYSTTMLERHWEMPCSCGSRNCRGRIRDFDLLPDNVQTSYIRQGIVQAFILQALKMKPHRIKG